MTFAEYAAALASLPSHLTQLPFGEVKIAIIESRDRIYVAHPDCQPLFWSEGRWSTMTFRPTIPE